jgi:iron complex outermembrane recepter protein
MNGQVAVFWRVAPGLQLYASSAQKDRFASLKDRYSLGQNFIQNPDLKPERALNHEVGAKASLSSSWDLEAAVFQSEVRNLIQQVTIGTGNQAQNQNQNVGRVLNSGFEMAATFKPSAHLQAGLTYMYLDRTNQSDPTIKLTGTPRNRLFGYLRLQPGTSYYFIASVSNQDTLWDTNAFRVPGFTTASLTAGWQLNPHFLFDGGFNNVMDRNYLLQTGFPMPGRTWFVNARYRF